MIKKLLAIMAALVICAVCFAGCDSSQNTTSNPVVEAYRNAAKKNVDAGDYDAAIQALEEGYEKTKDESLKAYLEEKIAF